MQSCCRTNIILLAALLLASCIPVGRTSTDAVEVVFATAVGDIVAEIYPSVAPGTASNFLRYVDEARLDSATFYRTVTMDNQPNNEIKIEVIQGGLSSAGSKRLPSIPHETTSMTGLLHLDGVLSMARSEPGSASSEFFICIGDQPDLDFGGLRNPDGQGFAAFGRVVQGMDVVKEIQSSPRTGQSLSPPIEMLSVRRVRQ